MMCTQIRNSPLNLSRPPHGHPVLIEAGQSEDGKNLAVAEVIFTVRQEIEASVTFRKDIRERVLRFGINRDQKLRARALK
jgi:alkanesulfonate monooxygenase